jgi:RNA polymerase sigma factor (sigma-70 family)
MLFGSSFSADIGVATIRGQRLEMRQEMSRMYRLEEGPGRSSTCRTSAAARDGKTTIGVGVAVVVVADRCRDIRGRHHSERACRALRARAGQAPLVTLAEQHMELARRIAQSRARKTGSDFDDVYSDALYGLLLAEQGYDGKRDFAHYASRWIVGEIHHGVRKRTGIRGDHRTKRLAAVSLDELATDTPDSSRLTAHEEAEFSALWAAVDGLPAKQRVATRMHYECGLPQQEIADAMGVSQMSVCRWLSAARESLAEAVAA